MIGRYDARPHDPAVAPAAGGSGDRVVNRRVFIGTLTGGLVAVPLAAEAPKGLWQKTELDPCSVAEGLRIVFGK